MEFMPIKTRKMLPPKDDLYAVLDESLPALSERDIVVVTSKVAAIHQGRCIKIEPTVDKDDLITEEAELYLPRDSNPYHSLITVKGHTLFSASGIDESNGSGYYVLWPEQPGKMAAEICAYLKQKHNLKELAVIITDSHSLPLRFGAVGIAIGWYGLAPLKDYRGQHDLFGRELKIERANLVDPLAAMAVHLMGEADEQTPFLLIRGLKNVEFVDRPTEDELFTDPDHDIFHAIYKIFTKGGKEKNKDI